MHYAEYDYISLQKIDTFPVRSEHFLDVSVKKNTRGKVQLIVDLVRLLIIDYRTNSTDVLHKVVIFKQRYILIITTCIKNYA